MLHKTKFFHFACQLLISCSLLTGSAYAKNYLYTPDGRAVPIKSGVTQPDISEYRSPLESKVVDRRFYTNEATFMANEQFKMGMEGWNDMVKAAMPVSYRRAFQWVVMRETYMYARNLLDYIGGRSHSGIHMVQGPYWTMKAERHSNFNRLQRDRGERAFSNKDIMLGFYLPLVYQRTGFPRVFDDIQVTYLQYKSVDPRFTGELDGDDTFVDPMSGKNGGWGVANTYFNDYTQRFDHDKMDTTFNLGALGQFLKRRSQWADRFYQSDRYDEIEGSHSLVHLLGNDAEEGMRGWGLSMASVNVMLKAKSSMFTDGESLMGINPKTYDPKQGLRYLPHEITPNIFWAGDLPERLWSMSIKDNSSQLWDQASWLWGTSAFAVMVNRRTDVFTANPPVDSGLIEKSTGEMAQALSVSIFRNVKAMHLKNGIFISEWTPENKTGDTITMQDMTMAIVALYDLQQSWKVLNKYPELRDEAVRIVRKNADFLIKVQNSAGGFSRAYKVDGSSIGEKNLSVSNFEAIRALIAAYFATQDETYLSAARKTFNYVNKTYWVESKGMYRTQLGDDTAIITPYSTGIALGAMREMLFVTPAHLVHPQIERLTRWWIQTVDQSGLMQAETKFTGEIYAGFASGDDDADGIPVVSKAYGSNGTAPVMAGKVVVNLAKGKNKKFDDIDGHLHNPNKFSPVKMSYVIQGIREQNTILIPEKIKQTSGFVVRNPMVREDGTTIPLQPAIPEKIALGIKHNLSGQQIFEANCQICHGQHGEGIDGKNLGNMMNFNYEVMFQVVNDGRFEKSMPPWGAGNNDDFGGTLKKGEIDRIIAYVQSDKFRKNHKKMEAGEVLADALPKDVWFFLSRDNLKYAGKKIFGEKEAEKYVKSQANPAKLQATWWENLRKNRESASVVLAP